ncbi:hypothetical protein CEUSTIGMA_g8939.t1 [Chlamydomonas eustigma]|uniref:Amine oxidase domain-containing protein n=1 Tax=Chlamydomonas eustigma TaxID=1157962 RepID=A0A250XEN5_9CHLO|nr:hypothetical protein CEUSTIGMA_g8939.t1 [Chlamydomonas eustigma]|eukprot:GAX81511.1 hypothetical protein CEUSTIGMA_g8939.t1 [Chlamydomonas eustigma]
MPTVRPQPFRGNANQGGNKVSDPVERARKGYRNSWSRYQVDLRKQVVWEQPFRNEASVAIIGGGLSGLCCALELAKQGMRSTVFDTGQHSCGGRLATRNTKDGSIRKSFLQDEAYSMSGLYFDHGAQYFSASDSRFVSLVNEWLAEGVIKEWVGPVGTLMPGGSFQSSTSSKGARYVAVQGMRSLAQHLEHQLSKQYSNLVQVRRPMWVGKMESIDNQGWRLMGEGKSLGIYDAVVIAHNGKCANRLMGPTGAPLVAQQLMGLRLSATWALMVAFDSPLPVKFEGATVVGSNVLSWVANNTAKLDLKHAPSSISCWTMTSTNEYAQANKVPQEAVPSEVQDKITSEMLDAFAAAIGVKRADIPKPIFYQCQLWGAALPLNTPSVECIFDAQSRVGVAGDWCSGSNMQAAAISGISLAGRIAALRGRGGSDVQDLSLGLTSPFTQLMPQKRHVTAHMQNHRS